MIRRAAVWLTSLCVLAAGGNTSKQVHVYVAGPPEAAMRARATLAELLERIGLEAVVERADDETALAATTPDAAPRAFLDLRSTAAPRVVLVERPSGRELERRTLPGSSSLEVAVEEATHVLYMALESSLHARDGAAAAAAGAPASPDGASSTATAPAATAPPTPPTTQPETTPATPKPATEASPPHGEHPESNAATELANTVAPRGETADRGRSSGGTTRLALDAGLSAFGAVASFEAEHVLPGVGAAVDAGLGRGPLRAAAWLSFGAFFPSPVSRNGQTGSVRAEAVRLAAMAEWFPWSRVGFTFGAGGGVDRISFDSGASTPAVESTGTTTRTDPMLEALAGMRFRIVPELSAFAMAALDVDLTPHRYVTESSAATATFFDLPRLRPGAFLGLTYVFHGANRGPTKEKSR